MEIRVEHSKDQSKIIIDKNKLIGAENEIFQNLVQESIDKGSKSISIKLGNRSSCSCLYNLHKSKC